MLNCPRCGRAHDVADTRCSSCGAELPAVQSDGERSPVPLRDRFEGAGLLGQYALLAQVPTPEGFGTTQIVDKNGQRYLLKHLRLPQPSDQLPVYRKLFEKECAFLKGVVHRGLPSVADYFARETEFYLLLTYSEGATLLHHIYPRAKPGDLTTLGDPVLPSYDYATYWARELASALLFLHSQIPFPMLHRNLSPWSVAITGAGRSIRLLDFGLLRCFGVILPDRHGVGDAELDAFTDPAIVSLEDADTRSDIFSYGRILDFLLTGFIPTSRGVPPAIASCDSYEDSDPRLRHLAEVVRRCCQPSPKDRYTSMLDVLDDLSLLGRAEKVADVDVLECTCGHRIGSSARFCPSCGRLLHAEEADDSTGAVPIEIGYDEDAQDELLDNHEHSHYAPFNQFDLRERLDEVQSDLGFDNLICMDALPDVSKDLPYQQEAALTALKRMRGRVLLADEVGLGKTIEAGIVLKELLQRQLVQNVLIICPRQLLAQWQSELYDKFGEVFLVMGRDRDIDTSLAWYCPRLIAPYHITEQRFHAEELLRHQYDLVVLDEAHYVNEPRNWKVLRTIQNLRKEYFLLLSATPMHTDLRELYNIVTLLRPGHFKDWEQFKSRFVDEESSTGTKNAEQLRGFLAQVMIRNTRREVSEHYHFPERRARHYELDISPESAQFYARFREFYQHGLKNVRNRRFLREMGDLVERLCSSPDAFRAAVSNSRRRIERQLGKGFFRQLDAFAAEYPREMVAPKIQEALDLAQQFVAQGHKVLIFSQFNETAMYSYEEARRTPLRESCFLYDEGAHYQEKARNLREFFGSRGGAVLFCPGEASEGLNLQCASVMINLDLPWDPMKIEQRIGRIQRIGGPKEVMIINLVLKGTIEQEIIAILEQRIRMFEAVIGKVEEIIGNLSDADDFRTMICNLYLDRDEENEDGEVLAPQARIETALDEAMERSSSQESENVLNSIFLDFGDEEEGEW